MRRFTAALLTALIALTVLPSLASADALTEPRWLSALNYLRSEGGLPDAIEVGRLSEYALQHARYAVDNDFRGHTEDESLPGATPEGRTAAEQSNLVYFNGPLTAVDSIYFWTGSISHLAWMMHPDLEHTGLGLYHRPADPDLQTVGVLNVIDGINTRDRRATATVWPADGATLPLARHGSCPDGIANLVITPGEDEADLTATAHAADGRELTTTRTDGLASGATGFTTCDVAAGDIVTWTVEADGDTHTKRVTYVAREDLEPWPTEPALQGEYAVPNALTVDAPAFGLSRRAAASATELAVTLAGEVFPSTGDADFAILSRDDDFADSLAGSALARFGPILFTPTGSLDVQVAEWLDAGLEPGDTVYLLGGEVALSANVDAAVTALGLRPVRLAGRSRTVTAVAVADEALELARTYFTATHPELYTTEDGWNAGRFNLSRAGNWADAIAVAPYSAGLTRAGGGCCIAPVTLLTPKDSLDSGVQEFVRESGLHLATVLGGAAAVAEHVPTGLDVSAVDRQAGANRAATAVEIGANLLDLGASGDETGILLIDGDREDGWAWGLAATSYAFHNDMAILMVRNGSIPPSTLDMVQQCIAVEVLGDLSIIPASVEQEISGRDC